MDLLFMNPALGTATGGLLIVVALLALGLPVARSFRRTEERGTKARHERLMASALDAIAGCRTISSVRAEVGPEDALDFLIMLLGVGDRIGSREQETLRALGAPFVGAARRLLRGRSEAERVLGVQLCTRFGGRIDPMVLCDRSSLVSSSAAFSLARSASREHRLSVLASLDEFESWGRSRLVSLLQVLTRTEVEGVARVVSDQSFSGRVRGAAWEALVLWEADHPDSVETGVLHELIPESLREEAWGTTTSFVDPWGGIGAWPGVPANGTPMPHGDETALESAA